MLTHQQVGSVATAAQAARPRISHASCAAARNITRNSRDSRTAAPQLNAHQPRPLRRGTIAQPRRQHASRAAAPQLNAQQQRQLRRSTIAQPRQQHP